MDFTEFSITLSKEEITIQGKSLYFYRPSLLEEIFQGDPFLETEKFPFWAILWPASIILAQYLTKIPPPKRILELGAGLGLPSLFAAAFGHKVLATDKDELPLKLLQKAASEQGITLATQPLDWLNPDLPHSFDLIVGAEIIFKSSLFAPLLNLFQRFLNGNGQILLAHEEERKRTLVPFLVKAEAFFTVETALYRIKDEMEEKVIILNRLTPK